jgi:hypothetical protein
MHQEVQRLSMIKFQTVCSAERLPQTGRSITPATTATAAAATSTATTTAKTATGAIFTRARFVDCQRTAIVFLGVEPIDRRLSLGVASHFNEPETLAAATVAVRDDLGTVHRSELRKHVFEV